MPLEDLCLQASSSARSRCLCRGRGKPDARENRREGDNCTTVMTFYLKGKAGSTHMCSFLQTVKKVSDPMSPEFKARLREEYIGLGGSANKVPPS